MRLRGATILGTESAELLVEEYQLTRQLIAAAPNRPGPSAVEQTLARALLERRDRYIAARIKATLKPWQTGVIFLGVLHSLVDKLAPDIEVTELFR